MQALRSVGQNIKRYANDRHISSSELSQKTGISENQIKMLYAGRIIPSFTQLRKIADILHIGIEDLQKTVLTDEGYEMMDCMNNFSDPSNREEILDIIYDYLDVLDAVES